MRILVTIFLISLICQSCFQSNNSNKHISILRDCDQVKLLYYNQGDTLSYSANDTSEISILTELISGRQDVIGDSCKPAGQVIYKSHGKTIFSTEFSTTDTNEEFDCNYVVYNLGDKIYKHKLNYRAGMLIDEILWGKLRSSTIKINTASIKLYKDTLKVIDTNIR
jgi:hypothetical protein